MSFKGNKFTGDITPALVDLVDKGLIRIIDLAIVSKDGDGTVAILERQELSPAVAEAMIKIEGTITGLLSEADLMEEAEALKPNNTAAALLVEHIWAKDLAKAVRGSQRRDRAVGAHPSRGCRGGEGNAHCGRWLIEGGKKNDRIETRAPEPHRQGRPHGSADCCHRRHGNRGFRPGSGRPGGRARRRAPPPPRRQKPRLRHRQASAKAASRS